MFLVSDQHNTNASKRLRILDPVMRLGRERGLDVLTLEELWAPQRTFERHTLERARVLYLHFLDFNLDSHAMMQEAIAAAQTCGVRVVADTDDAYFMPADHGPFDAALEPHLKCMRALAEQADLITVTCEPLADEMAALGRPVRVVPNWVSEDEFKPRPRHHGQLGRRGRLRVGFAGGPTHLLDLAAVLPAIGQLQRTHDFDFVLFGLFDRDMRATVERARTLTAKQAADPRLSAFSAFARALTGVHYTHHPSVPQAEFARALSALDLDIALCPLLDTAFNRCRSGVKFYQYAAVGTATLASDVAPYRGECEPLCGDTQAAWESALGRLLDNGPLREATLEAQQRYWRTHRTWSTVGPRFAEALLAPVAEQSDGGAAA